MMLKVIFANGEEGTVPSYGLDYLIREKKVIAFERSDGWAYVGRDQIRKKQMPLKRPGQRDYDFLFKRSNVEEQ